MTLKLAINGFGRIGRVVFREALQQGEVEVVAINDLTDAAMLAHLLKYDSVHGIFDADVSSEGEFLVVNGKKVRVYAEKDPSVLPWKDLEIDIVIESTGIFRDVESAGKHLEAGAKKVVMSAPSKDDTPMFVMGVVGTQFLSSPKKGLLILVLIHLINALFLLFSQRFFSQRLL